MGVYATVQFPMPCQRCHQGTVNAAQIKLGDCRQLPEYQVGDRIRFAAVRHSEFGSPDEIRDAVAVGYPHPCDYCGGFQLVSIVLKDGRIIAVRFRSLASWEPDNLLVGPQRQGRDAFVHGTRMSLAPTELQPWQTRLKPFHWPGHTLPKTLEWLVSAWLSRAIMLHAERDEDGRLLVDWSLGNVSLPSGFPSSLAERLSSGRLASAELKRWDFICAREAAAPPSIYELATPADSPQIGAYQSAIHAAQCSYW